MSRLTVVRSSHAGGFTQVLNSALRPERRLSAQALGVLMHLLSHNDGWDVSVESLTRQFKNSHTSMKATVRELKEAGYIEARRFNTATGMRHEWIVREQPISGQATDGLPADGSAADIKNTNLQKTKGSQGAENDGLAGASPNERPLERLKTLLCAYGYPDLDAEIVWMWIRDEERIERPDLFAADLDAKGQFEGFMFKTLCAIEVRYFNRRRYHDVDAELSSSVGGLW